MMVADLHTGAAQLTDALVQLESAWGRVRPAWNDETSRHFEAEHLAPISPTIRMTLDAVNRLADVLARAERECQDEDR